MYCMWIILLFVWYSDCFKYCVFGGAYVARLTEQVPCNLGDLGSAHSSGLPPLCLSTCWFSVYQP